MRDVRFVDPFRRIDPYAKWGLLRDLNGSLFELYFNGHRRQFLTLNGRRVCLQDWSADNQTIEFYMDEKFAECIKTSSVEYEWYENAIRWDITDDVWHTYISDVLVQMTPLHQESENRTHWKVSLQSLMGTSDTKEFMGGTGIENAFFAAQEWVRATLLVNQKEE